MGSFVKPSCFITLCTVFLIVNSHPNPNVGSKGKLIRFGPGDKFLGPRLQCAVCHLVAEGILDIYSKQSTMECLEAIAVKVCEILQIDGADNMVCTAIIPQFLDEVLYIFGKLVLAPDQLCNFLTSNQCGNAYHPRESKWNVTISTPKPPVIEPTLPEDGSPTLRVLHLSDIHYDKLYEPGADVMCNEPLCCRQYENPTNGTQDPAGMFGSSTGNCDIPLWTLENLFQHLQKNETFDYAIWTGDLPSHNVWNQTKSDQLTAYKTLTTLFLEYFPGKKIYSAVGNHESAPVNNFAPHYPGLPAEFDMTWLYNALAESWISLGVNVFQNDTIQNIASYVDKPFPGLRIISLNTIYCYNSNFWVFLNETDPDGALTWLVNQLQDAEDAGDKVHIIGHILPGQCMPQWSLNYYDIIYRYENIVTGQFFGHTHSDEFSVFYENANYTQRPYSMYYVGPSVTTYSGRNPAYRIYTIDGSYTNSSFRVLDHDTYFLNLTKANAMNNTLWEFEYNAKDAYGLTTLFPQDWSDLTNTMIQNDTIYQRYLTNYNRQPGNCEGDCKNGLLCGTRSAVAGYGDSLCGDLDSSETSSNLYYYEEPGWMEPIVARLSKAFPPGMRIETPPECQASTGSTSAPTVQACSTNQAGSTSSSASQTYAGTTQENNPGSGSKLKPLYHLLFIACFFIVLSWK